MKKKVLIAIFWIKEFPNRLDFHNGFEYLVDNQEY
jgi:hypothetical protein